MRSILPYAALLLLFALLLCPEAALLGARSGALLWWRSVFPALLPCCVALKLSEKLGLWGHPGRFGRGRLFLAAGFSLLAGAPNGARLLSTLVEEKALSPRQGAGLLPLVNQVSPAFLFSIIASDLLKNKLLFRPMALALYGAAALFTLPLLLKKAPAAAEPSAPPLPFAQAFSSAVWQSMGAMLQVGGCLVFACALLGVLQKVCPGPILSALLPALFEVSAGAAALSALSLPLRLKTSLLLGAACFGGLSLGLQALCAYPRGKLLPYLLQKLLLGALAGGLCYLLFPLFPDLAGAFAPRQVLLRRALSAGALGLSSLLSVLLLFLLSLMGANRGREN